MNGRPVTLLTRVRRSLSLAAAYLLFALGLIGLFIPLVPSTIFWILAAVAAADACPHLRARIFGWPVIGPVISAFILYGVIRPASKRIAVLCIGGMATALAVLLPVEWPWRAGVVATLLAVIAYILTRPSDVPSVGVEAGPEGEISRL